MRVNLQPAFILHRQPYRDTSLLVEAWTPVYGRIGLVARGVRTARSRLRGVLHPFIPLLLSWAGKGELLSLRAAEEAGVPMPLPSERLFSGFYVNELMLRLLKRHDPHPYLFAAYQQVLAALAHEPVQEAALRIFEKRLLSEIGYGLRLENEVLTGEPISCENNYCYVLDRGPCIGAADQGGIHVSGRSLLALQGEALEDSQVLRDAKRLTRAAIAMQLQGRPLKTRELLPVHRRSQHLHVTAKMGQVQ